MHLQLSSGLHSSGLLSCCVGSVILPVKAAGLRLHFYPHAALPSPSRPPPPTLTIPPLPLPLFLTLPLFLHLSRFGGFRSSFGGAPVAAL